MVFQWICCPLVVHFCLCWANISPGHSLGCCQVGVVSCISSSPFIDARAWISNMFYLTQGSPSYAVRCDMAQDASLKANFVYN